MRKHAKKWMALFTVAAVLAIAGSALAYGGRHHYGKSYGDGPAWGPGGAPCPGWHQGPGGRGMRPGGPGVDVPQSIRDKGVEADKLRIDLRAELSKPQIDRAKALEIWKKHRALRDEIAEWFFTQRLEWMANRPSETTPAAPLKPTAPQ